MKGRRHTTSAHRLLAALAFSVGCHAAGLLALSTLEVGSPSALGAGRIAVVLVGRGGAPGAGVDEDGGADGGGSATAPEDAAVTAPERGDGDTPGSSSGARAAARVAVRRAAPSRERTVDAGSPIAALQSAPSERDDDAPAGTSAAGAGAARGGSGPPAETAGSGTVGAAGGHGSGGDGADLRASCRSCPLPEYPARARRQGWQGTVDVDLRVGRDGVVEQASVGRSSGFAILDAAAVTVARRSRFWVSSREEGLRGQLRYRFVLEEALSRRPL